MADAVNTQVVFRGTKRFIVTLTSVSDGTGETAVVKVDKSTLIGPDGTEPSRIVVEKIEYAMDGMACRLYWDHDADDEIAMLSGAGYFDWTEGGGLCDPASAGGTGDIILTTFSHALGDSYTITLFLRLKD